MYTPTAAVRPFREAFDISRAAGRSWGAIKAAPLILWVGGVLRACTQGGGGGGAGGGGGGEHHAALLQPRPEGPAGLWAAAGLPTPAGGGSWPHGLSLAELDPGLIGLFAVLGVAALALYVAFVAWFTPGWNRLHAEVFQTGRGGWGTLFTAFDAFPATFWLTLLRLALAVLGVTVALVPIFLVDQLGEAGDTPLALALMFGWLGVVAVLAVYTFLGLYFADRVIALDGAGTWEAVRVSWALVDGWRVPFLVFAFVLGLAALCLYLVGILALCVGVIVTGPLALAFWDLCLSEAYLHLTRPAEETETWALRA